ncbi:hypothetical protein FOPE_12718 [Fonsecaea pedrosoi]|nr:hypothetical protein FOPE_12718 [Fonsecaea pedrosoi]
MPGPPGPKEHKFNNRQCTVQGHDLSAFIKDMRRGEGLTPMERFLDDAHDCRWVEGKRAMDKLLDWAWVGKGPRPKL